jgi:hypothetical protein
MRPLGLAGALLLAGCESSDRGATDSPSPASASAQPWVPEALTREHPIASVLPRVSASAPAPRPGSLTLESKSLGWAPGKQMTIGAAFAHLLEEWPTPRGGLPRLVIDRIELYAAGATGASCSSSGSTPPAGETPTAIVLQGKRKVEVEWEKDFAIGDDFELCVIGAGTGKQSPALACPGLDLGRANVILSLSRDRVGGRLNATSEIATVKGRFSAVVCPLPPLE